MVGGGVTTTRGHLNQRVTASGRLRNTELEAACFNSVVSFIPSVLLGKGTRIITLMTEEETELQSLT